MTDSNSLAALSRHLGTAITLDDQGCAQLVIDDTTLWLRADADPGRLTAMAVIGAIADSHRGTLLRLMLQANYGAALSGGGALAIDHDGAEALLIATWPLDGDDARLVQALTDFVNAIDYWQQVTATAFRMQAEPSAEEAFALAGRRV